MDRMAIIRPNRTNIIMIIKRTKYDYDDDDVSVYSYLGIQIIINKIKTIMKQTIKKVLGSGHLRGLQHIILLTTDYILVG
jgi:hypothetical protein